jgi:hypothetical protein
MNIVRVLAVTMLGACWWGTTPSPPASPSEPPSSSSQTPSSPPRRANASGPERWTYRYRHIQHADDVVTSVLEIDGERATLTTEGQTDWRDGKGWRSKGGDIMQGTLRDTGRTLLLDVASDRGAHSKLTCLMRTERVALATAIRIPDPSAPGRCDLDAVWSPSTTVAMEVLACGGQPPRSARRGQPHAVPRRPVLSAQRAARGGSAAAELHRDVHEALCVVAVATADRAGERDDVGHRRPGNVLDLRAALEAWSTSPHAPWRAHRPPSMVMITPLV